MAKITLRVPQQIRMDFFGDSPKDLQSRKDKVISALLENEPFTETKTLVGQIAQLGITYDDLCVKINLGNNSLIRSRDELGATIVMKLFKLANWCMLIADGNSTLLGSTGFALTGDAKPKPVFTEPQNLRIVSPKSLPSAAIMAKIDRVVPATTYKYDIAPIINGQQGAWADEPIAYCKYTFTGLVPGQTYAIRVGAVNKQGEVLFCDPIRAVAKL